jgi:gelsolin
MTGLVKAKEYDWKDSNLALFGSDTDKQVKKASADTEAAWQPVKAIKDSKVLVWRIEKFKVKEWPKEDCGKFYSGDSYIVLNVHKSADGRELLYDVHFWIGMNSTQDEYGTAAYKTVELDMFLDDKAIQHREVQGYESELFKSYFPVITIMKGGCDSGFRHVKPNEYQPRLLHFRSRDKSHVEVLEVKFSRKSLHSGDVFILDKGAEAFQWNGKTANKDERIKAAQFLQHLESERNGKCKTEVFDEADLSLEHAFYKALPDVDLDKEAAHVAENFHKSLFRLSDASGKMQFSLICENKVPKSMLEDHDVYIIDNSKTLFIYVGGAASKEEKLNAMSYAHNYLQQTHHPLIPITVLSAGQKSEEFNKMLD